METLMTNETREFDDEIDLDTEKLWAEEAERRLEELSSGTVKSRSAESVFRKVRSATR